MVFRRSRARSLGTIISSVKRIVDSSGSLAAGTTSSTTVAVGVAEGAAATVNSVPPGAHVYSMFITVNGVNTVNPGVVDWFISKDPGGQIGAGFGNPGDTGNPANNTVRKWIFHEEKGLASSTASPMIFKGVIKIPKKMQRFDVDDEINVKIRSAGAGFFCIKAIYKYYK